VRSSVLTSGCPLEQSPSLRGVIFAINGVDSSIIAGSTGDGYRLAELRATTNPSRWSGVLKVRNPAGVTEGLIPLDSNAWAVGQSKLEYFADCLEH
jgi:hypothetical protein